MKNAIFSNIQRIDESKESRLYLDCFVTQCLTHRLNIGIGTQSPQPIRTSLEAVQMMQVVSAEMKEKKQY